jgi:hypothetical protein
VCLIWQSCSRSCVLSTVEEVKAQGSPLHVLSMSTTVAAPSMSSATVPTTTVTAAVAAPVAVGGIATMIGVG